MFFRRPLTARDDRLPVAVQLKPCVVIVEFGPWRYQLDERAHSERGECAVGPNDLRAYSRIAVTVFFLTEFLGNQES